MHTYSRCFHSWSPPISWHLLMTGGAVLDAPDASRHRISPNTSSCLSVSNHACPLTRKHGDSMMCVFRFQKPFSFSLVADMHKLLLVKRIMKFSMYFRFLQMMEKVNVS